MKNNFTCNNIPHIVIAKNKEVGNAMISRLVDESTTDPQSQLEILYAPFRIHGKIGIMVGSNDETMQADTKIVQGIEVQETHKYVTRNLSTSGTIYELLNVVCDDAIPNKILKSFLLAHIISMYTVLTSKLKRH
jgi:hypothetical protein